MTKLRPILLSGLIALSLSACGMVSGPGSADIIAVAKSEMAANLGPAANDPQAQAAMQATVDAATISPKGMCNNYEKDKYACAVDVTATLPGAPSATTTMMMVKLTKAANGKWVATE
jgi:hypothetical protein